MRFLRFPMLPSPLKSGKWSVCAAPAALEKALSSDRACFANSSVKIKFYLSDVWTSYRDFFHVPAVFEIHIDDLTLELGIMYRVVLKLCATTICFQPINTDGIMVMASPPVTGDLNVEHLNTTQTGAEEKVKLMLSSHVIRFQCTLLNGNQTETFLKRICVYMFLPM